MAFLFTSNDSIVQSLPSDHLGCSEGKNMHCCLCFYVQVAVDCYKWVGLIETHSSSVKCKISVRWVIFA